MGRIGPSISEYVVNHSLRNTRGPARAVLGGRAQLTKRLIVARTMARCSGRIWIAGQEKVPHLDWRAEALVELSRGGQGPQLVRMPAGGSGRSASR